MEELQELAALQATISMLSRHALSSHHSTDDFLLAKFVLLLAELCNNAEDMSEKCSSMARRLQQISSSSTFLQDLFPDHKMDILRDTKLAAKSLTLAHYEENTASITLRGLERANSTLEDFCRSYFMFHELGIQSVGDVFKHFPILAFVESFIYQIDEQKEDLLLPSTEATLKRVVEEECLEPLHGILKSKNLWSTRVEGELKSGIQYWNLEHSLCSSLLMGEEISLSDVMQAIKLKSFDYRVLNLLLYAMLNKPVNEIHMEFLSASELLVEISDDLFDYEEDVLRNSFNILRMFLRIFGPQKAPHMLAQVIAEAEAKYQELLKKLEPSLASCYQNRCQQAVVEGGGSYSSTHPMGSWIIPSLITNEQLYREQFFMSSNTA
ncbi:hypothetical protein GOP47_0002118 [Adiantum capillus-veneris]|uniref:Uncharacterized protein n=1 Tax=Adiantum capillus-veneris TaxID=13818 RepID=A0A9D4ZRB7_ADICA|nr:hypothetical protein GOP47_0002118 [Adiantum capillus-veneris]